MEVLTPILTVLGVLLLALAYTNRNYFRPDPISFKPQDLVIVKYKGKRYEGRVISIDYCFAKVNLPTEVVDVWCSDVVKVGDS